MKLSISLFAIILISTSAISQKVKYDSANLTSIILDAFNDPALSQPYAVTANHDKYKNQLMRMLIQKKYPEILSIIKTKAFSSLIVSYNSGINRPKSDSAIVAALTQFRSNLPKDIPLTANSIKEERIFADFSRDESWRFTNKKGDYSRMTVMFTNGQITNILITL
jgi:hypothetical protein